MGKDETKSVHLKIQSSTNSKDKLPTKSYNDTSYIIKDYTEIIESPKTLVISDIIQLKVIIDMTYANLILYTNFNCIINILYYQFISLKECPTILDIQSINKKSINKNTHN